MNRHGHIVSYINLHETETAYVMQKLSKAFQHLYLKNVKFP